jgi:hypothetical protein
MATPGKVTHPYAVAKDRSNAAGVSAIAMFAGMGEASGWLARRLGGMSDSRGLF